MIPWQIIYIYIDDLIFTGWSSHCPLSSEGWIARSSAWTSRNATPLEPSPRTDSGDLGTWGWMVWPPVNLWKLLGLYIKSPWNPQKNNIYILGDGWFKRISSSKTWMRFKHTHKLMLLGWVAQPSTTFKPQISGWIFHDSSHEICTWLLPWPGTNELNLPRSAATPCGLRSSIRT